MMPLRWEVSMVAMVNKISMVLNYGIRLFQALNEET